jgi:hypothetical protein
MRKIIYLLFLFLSFSAFAQINDLKGNVKSLRVKVIPQKEKEETPEVEYYIDENGNEIKRTYKKDPDEVVIFGPYGERSNFKYLKKSYHKIWTENASPCFANFYLKLSKSRKPLDEIWYGYTNDDKIRHYYYDYYQNDSLKYEIDKHYKPYDTIKYFYNKFGKEKVIDINYYDYKREVDSSKTFYDKKGLVKYAMSYDKYPNPTILEYKATEETNTISYFGLRQILFRLLNRKQILNQNYFHLIRTYDKKNRLISIINYYDDNKNIIPSNETFMKYDDKNNIIEKKHLIYNWSRLQINTTNYNYENDLLTSVLFESSTNYSYKKFIKYYDNKLVKRIEFYSPNLIRFANFKYDIDRKGNWTKMTMTLFINGEESKHIVKRKIKYYN